MRGRLKAAAGRMLAATTGIGLILATAACGNSVSQLSANERNAISSLRIELAGSNAGSVSRTPIPQPVPIVTRNPVAAGIGAGLGILFVALIEAAAADSKEVKEAAHKNLRQAAESADVERLLLAGLNKPRESTAVPPIATSNASAVSAPASTPHALKIDYAVAFRAFGIGGTRALPVIAVVGLLTTPDGKTTVRRNVWVFCGVDMEMQAIATQGGAFIASELQRGAAVLGEAVLYDLFQNTETRYGTPSEGPLQGCMNFDDLPSGNGKRPERPRAAPSEPADKDKPA